MSEKAKASKRSRLLLVFSMLLFIGAALSSALIVNGMLVSFTLVVLGGFSMIISSRIREDNSKRKEQTGEPEDYKVRLPA
jgi:Sec-independent protein secretion pathway component TatC